MDQILNEENNTSGGLEVRTISLDRNQPLEGANVIVKDATTGEELVAGGQTDREGLSNRLVLDTPPANYSEEPSANQPYALYDVEVTLPGYESVETSGVQILPGRTAILQIKMVPEGADMNEDGENEEAQVYVIPPNKLYGDYPPKMPEAQIKPTRETGDIVLSRVVIPEYIVVHDGVPRDSGARDYYVTYKDYIKNVASSEIYATWPEATIYANILAIQSFTLNRVYTEWYRNQGYNFTITSSTAYDHKWVPGRNIYENISIAVDSIFNNYISRPNVTQPILTQYCDGERVTCPEWMSQWGSKYLGDQGLSAIDILRNYYGSDIFINSSEEIAGIPSSWPGSDLTVGTRSDKVAQLQRQLNTIARDYPAIPRIAADGIYGRNTEEAVREFQRIFNLPQTGVVDFPTWYKVSEVFVGVSQIAELR
ncbi:MAG: peptidoglycan-binding protein [Lachnospiraceae bacterium]|nr:peptidoglycan-binding protein [Lachnospiraceae bacterium]